MHTLFLATDFLGLTLGHMVVHPKIGLPSGALTETTLHELLVRGVSYPLITAVIAPVLALPRIVVVVIPTIGFELSEGKALLVVDVIGRLVGASSEQCQSSKHTSHDHEGFFNAA